MPLEFTAQPLFTRGTKTPCVARTTLQTNDLLQAFNLSEQTKKGIGDVSFNVMTRLIALEDVRERVRNQVDAAKKSILESGVQTQSGDRFAQLPAVMNLQQETESFLLNAKLALRDIAKLFDPFYGKLFSHDYRKIRRWAAQEFGEEDQLTKLLDTDCPWIDRVVKMRNVVEHPDNNPDAPLTIHNFRILNGAPPWKVVEPVWFMKDRTAAAIADDMDTIANNLLTLYEDLLIDCLLRRQGDGPFCIVEIPEADRDPDCPYRLTVGIKPEWSRGLP
jgi:hypothetical protein